MRSCMREGAGGGRWLARVRIVGGLALKRASNLAGALINGGLEQDPRAGMRQVMRDAVMLSMLLGQY